MTEIDYKKIGLKVGLEIHQQLNTHKLFCGCSSDILSIEGERITRYLRLTRSELGAVDIAAEAAAGRGRVYNYICPEGASCLVEKDEEPPHLPNPAAIETVLQVCAMLGSNVVDEIYFMRKIVLDGSNTSGFQRTALIGMGGKIKDIGIATICLEEDAARKISEDSESITYSLDRLGIPLIEIATNPEIISPEQARDVALSIGLLLRSTEKVKRGIGTIRQDLNVSINGGARVEIKGIQELNVIPKIVENEVMRQQKFLEVAEKLKERKASLGKILDVTEIFSSTQSKVLSSAISDNGRVFALSLNGFAGLLEKSPVEPRLGKELATYARVHSGIKGIFHSDELPGYGITEDEVLAVRSASGAGAHDAFILVAEKEETAKRAIEAVKERAGMAIEGVPEEVRKALPDCSTEYMRPMPGAARMYPETDVSPIRVSEELLARIRKSLPERLEEKVQRFVRQCNLSLEVAKQIVHSGEFERFELFAGYAPPAIAARIILNIIPEIESKGKDISKITDEDIIAVLDMLKQGRFAKEAIPNILEMIADGKTVFEAVECAGTASTEDLEKAVDKILRERIDFVKNKGLDSVGPLMGILMKEFRGKVDGAMMNRILTEKVKKVIK